MPRLFISYSRIDETFARQLAVALEKQGADVWVDVDDIPAGMKWSTAIQNGLDAADLMIVVISPESMASVNVEDEWQYYLDQHKPIIPVLLRHSKVHFQLSRIQYIDFQKQGFDKAFRQLHSELRRKGVTLKSLSTGEFPVQPAAQETQPPSAPTQNPPLVDDAPVPIPAQAPLPVQDKPTQPTSAQGRPLDYWASRLDDSPPSPQPKPARSLSLSPVIILAAVAVVLFGGAALLTNRNLGATATATRTPSPQAANTSLPPTLEAESIFATATALERIFQPVGTQTNIASKSAATVRATGTLAASQTVNVGSATGVIAFAAIQYSLADIYFINADGSNLRRISHDTASSCPVWSPDSKHIAYTSQSGVINLFVMDSDGSHIRQLTKNGLVGSVVWSPDSTQLAYIAAPSTTYSSTDIYVINADGSNPRRLTHGSVDGSSDNYSPVWSLDGKSILYTSSEIGGNSQPWSNYIDTTDAQVAAPRHLIKLPENGYEFDNVLDLSPDGKQLAVSADNKVYVLNADGSNLRQISSGKLYSWSPDGTQLLLYISGKTYTINPDGSAAKLIRDNGNDWAWSPDSKQLAYVVANGIGIINRNGTNMRQLTTDVNDTCPAWQPTAH